MIETKDCAIGITNVMHQQTRPITPQDRPTSTQLHIGWA
jgi:hypothetical protein